MAAPRLLAAADSRPPHRSLNSISTKSIWRERLTTFAPLFVWLGVIFYLSSGSGSMAETSRIIGPLIKFLFPAADESFVVCVHAFIRKSAHVTEYAILAVIASRTFRSRPVGSVVSKYWWLFALLLVSVTAAIDEINQSFNAQRTGSPRDVLLDISGGVLAVVLFKIGLNAWQRRRSQ